MAKGILGEEKLRALLVCLGVDLEALKLSQYGAIVVVLADGREAELLLEVDDNVHRSIMKYLQRKSLRLQDGHES